MAVGGAHGPISYTVYLCADMPGVGMAGPMGLSHLKASLKDPSFIKKIKDLEDRRQVQSTTIHGCASAA